MHNFSMAAQGRKSLQKVGSATFQYDNNSYLIA